MTLISITLDKAEQEFLLVLGDNNPRKDALVSVAGKIRRAQDISAFEVHHPQECKLSGWKAGDPDPRVTWREDQRLEAMRRMFQEET